MKKRCKRYLLGSIELITKVNFAIYMKVGIWLEKFHCPKHTTFDSATAATIKNWTQFKSILVISLIGPLSTIEQGAQLLDEMSLKWA